MKAFILGAAVGYVLGAKAGRGRYDQIMRTYRKIADHPAVQGAAGIARAKLNLAQILERQGNALEALPMLREAASEFDEFGDPLGIQSCVARMIHCGVQLGRFREAAQLMAIEAEFAEQLRAPMSPTDAADFEDACSQIHSHLDPDEIEAIRTDSLATVGRRPVQVAMEIAARMG